MVWDMTLSRQLILLIAGLVILLFAGTLAISVHHSRSYLESQLASHAQDAATSLGLSATSHVDSGDQAMVTAMVNAMFHRGDYQSIRFQDLQGGIWLERAVDLQLDDVPGWFQKALPLQPPQRSATMMAGWRQVGKVSVVSHPGLAYRKLWQTATQTAKLFLIATLVAVVAGMLGLRVLLRPLRDVEAQAAAICSREFPVVEKRPFALELRPVVEAMNRLSSRVARMLADAESLAAELRRQAYQDPVTGLANRRQFMDVLGHRVGDREALGSGGLLLLRGSSRGGSCGSGAAPHDHGSPTRRPAPHAGDGLGLRHETERNDIKHEQKGEPGRDSDTSYELFHDVPPSPVSGPLRRRQHE